MVNGKKMNIPSYQLKVGDILTMKAKTAKIPAVAETMKQEVHLPAWLEAKNGAAHVNKLPGREDVTEKIEEQLIVEYYNR